MWWLKVQLGLMLVWLPVSRRDINLCSPEMQPGNSLMGLSYPHFAEKNDLEPLLRMLPSLPIRERLVPP